MMDTTQRNTAEYRVDPVTLTVIWNSLVSNP